MQLSFSGMEPHEPAPGRAAERPERGPDPGLSIAELSEAAGRYLDRSHAERTLVAYRRDWDRFERFCRARRLQPMPCAPQTLALYLTALAEQGKATSSIRRTRIAIARLHARQGHPRPDAAACVRDVERGIRRSHGVAQKQARPLLVHELKQMVQGLGAQALDLRDRALLLVGFAGGFRRAELVTLDLEDVERCDQGLLLRLPRGKSDRWGKGEYTALPFASDPALCPVRAFDCYLQALKERSTGAATGGPLFRSGGRGARRSALGQGRLAAGSVGQILRRAAAQAGLDSEAYSSHSLRAGLATSAYLAGASMSDIQRQGRWSSQRAMLRYVRIAADFGPRNAAAQVLWAGPGSATTATPTAPK